MALVQSTVVVGLEIEHVVAITLGQLMVVKIAFQQETSCTLNMISATLIAVVCIIWKSIVRSVLGYSKEILYNIRVRLFRKQKKILKLVLYMKFRNSLPMESLAVGPLL